MGLAAHLQAVQSFNTFFDLLGPERSGQIASVASDMWKAFLHVCKRAAAKWWTCWIDSTSCSQ
jgi:hypothetical protein